MQAKEIVEYFNVRRDDLIDAIREIVDIESPSHDAVRSRQVVDLVERRFQEVGVPLETDRIECDDGDHLIVRAFPGSGPVTVLLGHTDTVHPVGTHELNPTRIDGDRFYGCGIFDMKANIVVMFEAFRLMAAQGMRPHGPVTVVLSCDEEVGSHSGREFVEREARGATRCLVLEPSADGAVKTGRKGTGWYALKARGIPAHAGLEPEKGANAVVEIARHIETISALADPSVGTTVNVCTIKGGTTSNVIPEHCECEIDVRFTTASEAERVDAALRRIGNLDPRITVELSGDINRPPMERSPEVIGLYETARSLATSFGYDLAETQVGGASDGNFVAALGIPVLDGLGIKGAGAHTLDEHILVSDVANRATLISLLLAA